MADEIVQDGNAAPPSDDGQQTEVPGGDADIAAGEETQVDQSVAQALAPNWDADENPHKVEAMRLKAEKEAVEAERYRLEQTLAGTRGNLDQIKKRQVADLEERVVLMAKAQAADQGEPLNAEQVAALRTEVRARIANDLASEDLRSREEHLQRMATPIAIQKWAEAEGKEHPAGAEELAAYAIELNLQPEQAEALKGLLKRTYARFDGKERKAKLADRTKTGTDRVEGGGGGPVKSFARIEQDYIDGKTNYEQYAAAREKAGIS